MAVYITANYYKFCFFNWLGSLLQEGEKHGAELHVRVLDFLLESMINSECKLSEKNRGVAPTGVRSAEGAVPLLRERLNLNFQVQMWGFNHFYCHKTILVARNRYQGGLIINFIHRKIR